MPGGPSAIRRRPICTTLPGANHRLQVTFLLIGLILIALRTGAFDFRNSVTGTDMLVSMNGAVSQERSEPVRRRVGLEPDIMADVFKRHCKWDAPENFLKSLAEANYSVPALVEASAEHCQESSLPYTSLDLWYHHADVRIVAVCPPLVWLDHRPHPS